MNLNILLNILAKNLVTVGEEKPRLSDKMADFITFLPKEFHANRPYCGKH